MAWLILLSGSEPHLDWAYSRDNVEFLLDCTGSRATHVAIDCADGFNTLNGGWLSALRAQLDDRGYGEIGTVARSPEGLTDLVSFHEGDVTRAARTALVINESREV